MTIDNFILPKCLFIKIIEVLQLNPFVKILSAYGYGVVCFLKAFESFKRRWHGIHLYQPQTACVLTGIDHD